MIDDPVSLVLWSSWLMAAGMYPIGFLFGACSDCCDGCPEECSKCTHHVNAQSSANLCDTYFFGTGRTVTVSVAGQGSDTLSNPLREPEERFGIPLFGFPDIGLAPGSVPTLRINVIEGYSDFNLCGCNMCTATYSLFVKFSYPEENDTVDCQTTALIPFDLCNETTKTVDVSGGWQISNFAFGAGPDALLAWLNSLTINVTLSLPECDCGACCDNGCEENVAEGGCTAWQGVGVDCDPDPCV